MTSDEIKKCFSQNLKRMRKERGLTQESLADATDLSLQAVSDIECGRRWPRVETLSLICKTLNCNVAALFSEGSFDSADAVAH